MRRILNKLLRAPAVRHYGKTDHELLRSFVEHRDEPAFAELVRRHGGWVLGLCRRMLNHEADAQDASQATWLVLVRRAREIGKRTSIGPWLHGVAHRVVLRVIRDQARRRKREQNMLPPTCNSERPDYQTFLDEEISRLPDGLREPIVLVYVQGKPPAEGAKQLNLEPKTFQKRLERARARLRERLTRRGINEAVAIIALSHLQVEAGATMTAAQAHALATAVVGGAVGRQVTALAAGIVRELWRESITNQLFKYVLPLILLTGLAVGGAILNINTQSPNSVPSDSPVTACFREETVFAPGINAFCVAFNPNGQNQRYVIAVAKNRGTGINSIHLFDTHGKPSTTLPLTLHDLEIPWFQDLGLNLSVHTTAVRSIQFSPDGSVLVAGTKSGRILFWDLTQGVPKPVLIPSKGTAHSDQVNGLAFSPDGALLVSSSRDETLRLWHVSATARELASYPLGPQLDLGEVQFSPDGAKLALACRAWLRVYRSDTLGPGRVPMVLGEFKGDCRKVAFSPDGQRLATCEGNDLVLLEFGGEHGLSKNATLRDTKVGMAHTKEIEGIAWGRQGLLVSGGGDRIVRLWDPNTCAMLDSRQLGEEQTGNTFPAFSPDGGRVAVTAQDKCVLFRLFQ